MSDNRVFGQNIFGTHSAQRPANRYPLWRYFASAFVVTVCVVYALPNLYPPDFALQVQSDNSTTVIGDRFIEQARTLLETEGVSVKGAERIATGAQIRLQSDVDSIHPEWIANSSLHLI